MKKHLQNGGFTLIELLVVIAIIGLLSAIILANLNGAKSRAKDATVEEEVHQMATLLQENYSDTGNFLALEKGWSGLTTPTPTNPFYSNPCSFDSGGAGGFYGTYSTQAISICTNIINNTVDATVYGPGYNARLLVTAPADETDGQGHKYTIMAWLSGAQTFYCMGSNGSVSSNDPGAGTSPGCYNDPNI